MKERTLKTKLLTILLALCMVLSLVPMTAFATTIELPPGVSREYLYNHTYHTKVEITANVSVKDAGGSVIETAQVNKSGDFVEGNVSDPAVQAEIQGFDAEINAPYSSRGTLAVENRTTSLKFDHFDGSNLYSFVPASGDTVDFGTDTEAIEQYFAEHPDAVGTFNTINNVREYQVHQITYDLIVQESGTTPAAVENVTLDYENISYKAGDTPRAAASVSRGNCTVAYECWTEIRQPEGGGQWYETGRRWYSDSDKMAALPADERIINFEAGNSYQYNVVLAADSGYSFSNDETVVSVGEDEWGTPKSHKKLEIKESGKELHIKRIYTFDLPNAGQPNAITSAAVENVKLDYKHGDAPQATAAVAAADQGKYRIADEYWQELNENDVAVAVWHSDDGAYSTLPTITAFESGKKYVYSVLLMPEREYDFGREVAATVNGNAVTAVPATDGYLSLPNVKTIIPTESYNPTVIDLIEINDVTVSFKDGDKPKFTGSVPDNAGYAFRCEWWSLDSDTGIVSTEPEWGGDIYKNKITAFKAGKTYHYGVYVTAYTANISPDAKLKINGREVNYTRIGDDGDTQSFWVETNLTMTPTAAGETPNYKIIEGANGAWTQNSDGTLTFRANGDFSKFTGVKVDGTLIDAKNYTAKSGSTVITLKADYLKTLSVGTHKLTVVYTDGECSTNFEVKQAASEQTKPTEGDKSDTTTPTGGKDTTSPQTGDNSNMLLWVALLFVSVAGVLGTTVYSKKKRVR